MKQILVGTGSLQRRAWYATRPLVRRGDPIASRSDARSPEREPALPLRDGRVAPGSPHPGELELVRMGVEPVPQSTGHRVPPECTP